MLPDLELGGRQSVVLLVVQGLVYLEDGHKTVPVLLLLQLCPTAGFISLVANQYKFFSDLALPFLKFVPKSPNFAILSACKYLLVFELWL
jgi:hypothetical protein